MTETTDILRTRLHVTKLPCYYGLGGEGCPLCKKRGKIATEYYFADSCATRRLAEVWDMNSDYLKQVPQQTSETHAMELLNVVRTKVTHLTVCLSLHL